MTGQPGPATRRLGRVLRHLGWLPAAAGGRARPLAAAAEHAAEGVDTDLVAHHLEALERDGVTVLEDLYSREQIAEWQRALVEGWEPVQEGLSSLEWLTFRFKQPFLEMNSYATGKVLCKYNSDSHRSQLPQLQIFQRTSRGGF